ncbi:putative membrane protein [Methanobacterium aggregans]|nr:putative membrane protein [Methanobacterium aggregans]
MYSSIGSYYFHVANSSIANAFILTFAPWFMQLLFAIAGIATYYSLKRRDAKQYLKERVSKLLLPTVAGAILVIPVSVYFGFLYSGYTGSFPSLWLSIFSHPLENLANGIIVGPLWFLLYLFIISVVALPLIMKYKKGKWRIPLEKVTVPKLLLGIIPLTIGSFFLNLYPDKSIVQFLLLFLAGYFLLSDDSVQEKLEDKRWPLFISFVVLTVIYVVMALSILSSSGDAASAATSTLIISLFLMKLYANVILWLGVLGVMGMGKHYLEFKTPKTLYLSAASFPIYIFHIIWVNLFAYYIIGWVPSMMALQVILTMALSFVFTIATIEVVRRIKGVRFLFGIKG